MKYIKYVCISMGFNDMLLDHAASIVASAFASYVVNIQSHGQANVALTMMILTWWW